MMTLVLGLTLKLFTPNHYISYTVDFGASLYYLLFPAVAIAIPKIAMTVKLLKSSIHAEYRRDYVRTAISRGSTRRRVLYTHVLRNAIIPVVTFLALTIPEIVAGSIIIEQVFTIPGLGRLLISSILNRDFPSGMRHCHVDCGARNPYEFFGGHALPRQLIRASESIRRRRNETLPCLHENWRRNFRCNDFADSHSGVLDAVQYDCDG